MHRAANICFALALLTATLLVGGVHTPVAAGVLLLAIAAFAFRSVELRDRDEHEVFVSLPVLGLLLLTAVAFFQIIPLPEFVQRILSPSGHAIVSGGFTAAGLDAEVSFRALSLEPGATADRVIRFATLAVVGIFAANLRDRVAWFHVGRTILGVAIAVLLVGAVLDATHMREFPGGIYQTVVGFRGPSTFVNLNHGAAFFGLASMIAVALATTADHERPVEPIGYWIAALLFAGATVIHDSDGVLLALGVCAVLAAFGAWWRKGRPTSMTRPTRVAAAILVTAAVAVAVWLDIAHTGYEFMRRLALEGEHGNRWELTRASLRMIEDFWLFGGGAGAVQTVIPAYMDWIATTVEASIPVMENDTFEILYGFGVFVGGIALASFASLFVFAFRHAFRGERGSRHLVALVSAAYLFFVAQLHFPLFALGIGVPAIAWLEALVARRPGTKSKGLLDTGHIAIGRRASLLLVGVLFAVSSAALFARYVAYDAELPETLEESGLHAYLRDWPADQRVFVRLATKKARDGKPQEALSLARWAAERNTAPRIRLFLARALANADEREEAADLYRVLLRERGADRAVIRSVLADFRDPETRVAVFGPHPGTWSEATKLSLRIEGGVPSAELALAIVAAHPDSPLAYRVATEAYLAMKQPVLARIWAELLLQKKLTRGQDVEGVELLARALIANDDRERAGILIDRTVEKYDGVAIPVLHRLALRLVPGVDKSDEADVARAELHYGLLCQSPIAAEDVRQCWVMEAWLAEKRDDLETTRRILERVKRKFDDPMPVAYFFFRHFNCHELSRLDGDLPEDSPHRGTARNLHKRCVSAVQKHDQAVGRPTQGEPELDLPEMYD